MIANPSLPLHPYKALMRGLVTLRLTPLPSSLLGSKLCSKYRLMHHLSSYLQGFLYIHKLHLLMPLSVSYLSSPKELYQLKLGLIE